VTAVTGGVETGYRWDGIFRDNGRIKIISVMVDAIPGKRYSRSTELVHNSIPQPRQAAQFQDFPLPRSRRVLLESAKYRLAFGFEQRTEVRSFCHLLEVRGPSRSLPAATRLCVCRVYRSVNRRPGGRRSL
jgi:hypothetical protein